MDQIKNYLSRHLNIHRVLTLGTGEEWTTFEHWLSETKGMEVHGLRSFTDGCNGISNSNISKTPSEAAVTQNASEIKAESFYDAVIFDYEREDMLLELSGISCTYLIGRVQKDEDYFSVWEKYREICDGIYISRDKGLAPEQITADIAPNEVLEWDRPGNTKRPEAYRSNNKAGDSDKRSDRNIDKNIDRNTDRNMDCELSVILPVYNIRDYLPACLESLTAWKAPYVEFLFINDGSTDGSDEVIRSFSEKDSRVKLITKENGGCASARNRGIEEAKGRLLGFVDPDDFVDETMFPKLFARAIMGNYDLTYCGYQEYYEDTKTSEPVLNDCLKEPYLGGTYRKDKVDLLSVNTRVAIWRCLYKKQILDSLNLRFHEDLRRFDDLPFRLEYIFAAKSAACVPEYLYFYRLGRKGQDVACSDERLYVHFPIFEHLDAYVDPLKDKRLQDLLQIVKIQTHGFALSKLERKYRKEYIRQARTQLNRNMGYFRTLNLILMYTGKGNIGWYTLMKLHLLF